MLFAYSKIKGSVFSGGSVRHPGTLLFAEGPALTFWKLEMPSLYLSAPFSPPSVLLYSAWKTSVSQL